MRSGDSLRRDVLRMAANAAYNVEKRNQRPLTAVELEKLAEYLWQFTMFNNSDHVVVSSRVTTAGGSLVHTIRMGQLVRGASGKVISSTPLASKAAKESQ